MMVQVTLANAVERNLANPNTFEIPSKEERTSLQPGTYAKIILLDDFGTGERIWTRIIARLENGGYLGSFANQPFISGLNMEDVIIFQEYHIIDFDVPEKTLAVMS